MPFLGTSLGAAAVFFLRGAMKPALEKALLGFASGVMLAASVWSLLLPAVDMSAARGDRLPWLSAAAGFAAGFAVLRLTNGAADRLNAVRGAGPTERTALLVLAVTLHNVPEGMAVGAALAGLGGASAGIVPAEVMALAAGIAVQNVPEGAIVSLPLAARRPKPRAMLSGVLSGLVEPVGTAATLLLAPLLTPVLPALLAFAAGAMVYAAARELIPGSQTGPGREAGTLGLAAGWTLMMTLDVALG